MPRTKEIFVPLQPQNNIIMLKLTTTQQEKAAKEFSSFWKDKGYEKGESQAFWLGLLRDVFGIEHPETFITFEDQVKLDHTSFIDGHIRQTHVLIEQKSINKNLHDPIKQSDGSLLTPFQQAKRYSADLPYSDRPRWIVTCNFRSFLVYDMEQPNGEPEEILLENLEKEYYRLSFLVDLGNIHLQKEMEISLKAGEIIGEIYDALLKQYIHPESAETLRSLNVLCVRIVFCLYAEDAGLFGSRSKFHDYLIKYQPGQGEMRKALIDLFEVLNTPINQRDPYLPDDLAAFPYCNGGLFSEKDIEIPRFNDEIAHLLLKNASDDFDWSEISPTIFGGVFESTLNPETRRSGGMHYTSIENIHKVIDHLFLNDLKNELQKIKVEKVERTRIEKAKKFQEKLASLTFLDPSCGSGNFLTETYLSLRRLENEAILIYTKGQVQMGLEETNPIRVSIHQFYGIEINDFAVDVATTALWIAESQMLKETEKIIDTQLDMLPLKTYRNIKKGNALRESWTEWECDEGFPDIYSRETNLYVMPESQLPSVSEPTFQYEGINLHTEKINLNPRPNKTRTVSFDYIMGNPPFVGARLMSSSQKEDMLDLFGKKWQNIGNMDYVCSWYYKATTVLGKNEMAKVAFVSTNSVTQGEQVANLWKPLFENYGIHIDFAYRTFRWDSESSLKAHVHCVIVGFSKEYDSQKRVIYNESGKEFPVKNINGYLLDAPNIFIESRNKPLCDVPEIGIGNKPIDGGNYLFKEDEMKAFIKKEPQAEKLFRKWIGADEFINRWHRYCLWLGECQPHELSKMPECFKRVKAVREFRLASSSGGTRKLADRPTRFHVENMPQGNYIVIPETSSEKRKYVPMGFMSPDVFCSNAIRIMPDATLYHFGILTSNVHNAWLRAVGGRLKSDYRYSKDIVYNNFPWPTPTPEQQAKIEQTAQAILDARAQYPDSSLADLYNETLMPIELRKAHLDNDKAVMKAYGFDVKMTESERVAALMELYVELTK